MNNLELITTEGFTDTGERFGSVEPWLIYQKENERIIYSKKDDRIVVRYDVKKVYAK